MAKIGKYFLSGLIVVAIFVTATLALPLPSAPLVGTGGNYTLRNINIVDVLGGTVTSNASVRVADGRIQEIGTAGGVAEPLDRIIEGEGLYLIPGLWDMHTHSLQLSPQLHHPLFISNGVTSTRDMSGCLDRDDAYWACPADRREWNRATLAGELVSPRYVLQSSYQTNGGTEVPGGFPEFFRLGSPDDATRMAAFYAGEEVDFIKTYSELSPDQFRALSAAAPGHGLELAGHKPIKVELSDALAANMRSIEHGRLFMFECYRDIAQYRALENPLAAYTPQKIRDIMNHRDESTCGELMIEMGQTETHWVPTLTTLQMSARSRDEAFRNDERLASVAGIVKTLLWEPDANRAAESGYDENADFVHQDYFRMASRQVGLAHAQGVKILAGTDNIDSYVFTGSSLHDELMMLVEAGLSPGAALRAATIDAATFAGFEAELGSVEMGKSADLVLLRGNPLADIGHTRAIAAVMLNGVFYDREALDALEGFAMDMAQSYRINLHYLVDLLASPLMRAQLAD